MSKTIHLQLAESSYQLANISENINGSPNDFIKILLNENTRTTAKGVIIVEFTLHPKKTQRKEIISKKVNLFGDYENKITEINNRNIHYSDIYKNLGYENFNEEILIIYQCSYQTGFPPQTKEIDNENCNDFLTLKIEHDDPFWLGIVYCKKKEVLEKVFHDKNISEYIIAKCYGGFIVIAVKKLKPEWEKYNLPKDKSNLGHYTEHDNFSL